MDSINFQEQINSIGVLVLAAGGSSRLGQPKQLVKIKGKTLLQHSIHAALACDLEKIIVVLGANASLIGKSIKSTPVLVCLNPEWSSGISSSISIGIKKLLEQYPQLSGVLILLSDQPFVSKQLLSQMLNAFLHSGKEIIASKYGETIGVPAIFSKIYFDELKSLQGDVGARRIIMQNPGQVGPIFFDKGEIDIDTPDDIKELLKRMGENKAGIDELD